MIKSLIQRYSPHLDKMEESFNWAPPDLRNQFQAKFVGLKKTYIFRKVKADVEKKLNQANLTKLLCKKNQEFYINQLKDRELLHM